jgi:hypothetical protein
MLDTSIENKHAFLIAAHDQFSLLKKLILLLDDRRNDIYLHIDAKSKNFSRQDFDHLTSHARLFILPRINVEWGTFSQVQSTLCLLKTAMHQQNYAYYHLLSGCDLPLQSQDEIHRFFDENQGKEFIHFCTDEFAEKNRWRASLYHFFPIRSRADWISMKIQERLGINRLKNDPYILKMGSNWFSITHDLAAYICSHEKEIIHRFRYTACSDELFLQSMIIGTPFMQRLYRTPNKDDYAACMRLIDWERGDPYIFRMADQKELFSSKMMFARKFDEKVDPNIISYIVGMH